MMGTPSPGGQGPRHPHGGARVPADPGAAVRVRAGQMELYGDMNRRFRTICQAFAARVEPYSIDECFLDVTKIADHPRHATALRAAVHRQLGIQVRVGIGPTKTLAKLANHLARTAPSGTCCLPTPDPVRRLSPRAGPETRGHEGASGPGGPTRSRTGIRTDGEDQRQGTARPFWRRVPAVRPMKKKTCPPPPPPPPMALTLIRC